MKAGICAIAFAWFCGPALSLELDADGASLPSVHIYFIGEVHDNPEHHLVQETLITALNPAAIVFEMLTPEQAGRITTDLRNDQQALEKALNWDQSGWPDFTFYYPLFSAAPDSLILGAGIPRDAARAAMNMPVDAIFGPEAALFGLDQPLPAPEQETREALQASAHCNALPEDLLPFMVSVQRLRDARLAQAALQGFRVTQGPVVVITGTGHARNDWGAPALLRSAAPELQVISIGQFEYRPQNPPHDYWVKADPHPRADPCAAFQ